MTVEQRLRRDFDGYLARDFVETRDGLLLAVVASGLEAGRVLGWLRYVRDAGGLRKLDTAAAHAWLHAHDPDLLYRSPHRDALLHGVPCARVTRHFHPAAQLAEILSLPGPRALDRKVVQLVGLIAAAPRDVQDLGITGSRLIGAHHAGSDIDVVCYGRPLFHAARERLRAATCAGTLQELPERLWRDAYARRGCALSYGEYRWHERRKDNKGARKNKLPECGYVEFGRI